MRLSRSPRALRGSVPSLAVEDVEAAVAYYERFLGFRLVSLAGDPPSALVQRDDSAVLLRPRHATDAHRNPGDREHPAWDAVIPVRDFVATLEDLSVRAVSIQSPVIEHPVLGQTVTIEDRFGNLLCISQADAGLDARLRRRVAATRSRWRSARFEREAVAELAPHLEAFRAFYNRLDDRRDVFYMFFTGGLLHWAAKAASFVPPEVNLVLLGAELSDEEKEWATTRSGRPFHHIDLPVNDWPVWDFLLTTSDENFGWIDIDCFVLNESVFAELADIAPDVAVNCTWSYDTGFGFPIANTYLAFVNVAAVRAMRAHGLPIWARPHDWLGGDRSEQAGKRCFYRVPTAKEVAVLRRVASSDSRGRPRPPGSMNFFDTLSVFQLEAQALGFRAHLVRELDSPMLGPVGADGKPSVAPAEMSDELIHVGGISYYREHFHDPAVRMLYLAADYTTVAATSGLPAAYRQFADELARELRDLGVAPESAGDILTGYLCGQGGMSDSAAAATLAPGRFRSGTEHPAR